MYNAKRYAELSAKENLTVKERNELLGLILLEADWDEEKKEYKNVELHRSGGAWEKKGYSEFYSDNSYRLTPTPTYAELQAKWIKENGVKVGDKAKLVRSWEKGEKGITFNSIGTPIKINNNVLITFLANDRVGIRSITGNADTYFVPYFALELIKEPSYAELQVEWLKNNKLSIGDYVEFKAWKYGEKGFDRPCADALEDVCKLLKFYSNEFECINVEKSCNSDYLWHIPYFAITKIISKEEYELQKFVKDNDLKVGDPIKVEFRLNECSFVGTIDKILKTEIIVNRERDHFIYPYACKLNNLIPIPKPTYRAFQTLEEFMPNIGRQVIDKDGNIDTIIGYNVETAEIQLHFLCDVDFKDAFKFLQFINKDTGEKTPCGIKI
jgi:hypothetical protein